MDIVKKAVKANKDGFRGFMKGYAEDGEIHMTNNVVEAMLFDPMEKWFEEEELNKAKEYLIKNGYDYDEYIVEITLERVKLD